jgi:hypothetical protein
MEINLTLYGAGLGLVLCGWTAGLVVGFLFSVNRNIGRLPTRD